MQPILEKMLQELELRNYSKKTISCYMKYAKDFLIYVSNNRKDNKEDAIKDFILDMKNQEKSPQTINLALNAIKFFYQDVMKVEGKIEIRSLKRSSKIPIVLSRDEIKKIIDNIKNR